MSNEKDEEGHTPGECAGCDTGRCWNDLHPVFDKHAAETGRGQGELVHLTMCRYVDDLAQMGALQQAEHLVAEMALIVMAHRGEQDTAQEEAAESTKH